MSGAPDVRGGTEQDFNVEAAVLQGGGAALRDGWFCGPVPPATEASRPRAG
ncbi:MAG TPA: hypothetical protein VFV41_12935 [Streptosporangiaceae bacterium]|nr:hypothetical protein [Streptosporangiaceae bacterium]